MSLTNPNKPVTEARLQEFYHRIKNFLGFTEMPSEDMSEVVSPIPGVTSKLPVLFDESGAEYQIGWYKYANGTKKPVYEKSFVYNNTITNFNTHVKIADIGDLHVDILVSLFGATNNHTGVSNIAVPIGYYCESNGSDARIFYIKKTTDPGIYTRGTATGILSVIMRYTKTTDTPQ